MVKKLTQIRSSKVNIENGFVGCGILHLDRNICSRFIEQQVQQIALMKTKKTCISEYSGEVAVVTGPTTLKHHLNSPEFISPLPNAEPRRKKTCKGKPSKSRMLTDTPKKAEIEEVLKVKQGKLKMREEKNREDEQKLKEKSSTHGKKNCHQ
ncbi:hypothetical protein HHI36_008527 [Cryptolaemus montrouzieri]|uniref:Uncharacterized protein n=1 Tax=Cryptolaemus montrouzieri TaxID=559131 RepID=A0ABD2MTA2_9CUCU